MRITKTGGKGVPGACGSVVSVHLAKHYRKPAQAVWPETVAGGIKQHMTGEDVSCYVLAIALFSLQLKRQA